MTQVESISEEIEGMNESAAKTLIRRRGLVSRVEKKDGVDESGITMDHRLDRINLTIEDGTVTNTRIG